MPIPAEPGSRMSMTRVGWCPGGRPVAEMLAMYPGTTAIRVFVGAGKPLPAWDGPILGPIPAGVLIHLSFKTWDLPAVERWLAAMPAEHAPIILTYAHEPEQGTAAGDPTVEQFRTRWAELVAALADHPRRGDVLLVPVYTRFWWQAHPGDLRWLVPMVDAYGWDIYNNGPTYRTPDDLLSIPRDIAKRTGLPWLIAELGAVRVAGDKDGSGRARWMRDMVAAAKSDGAWTVCWFHKDEWTLAPAVTATADDPATERQTWQDITEKEAPGLIVSGIKYVAGRNDYGDRDGTKYGIAIHNTSNTASAADEASYATRRTDGTSSHFYADGREVIQSLDTKYRAGHAGSTEGNEHAVAVEITGTNDKSRAWWIANVAWDELGAVLAAVCRKYDIQPRRASVAEMKANPRVRAFYSHDDMRRAWGGTTHTDPGPNFPWDHLLATVKTHLNPEDDMPLTTDDINKVASRVWSATWGPETAGGRLGEARDEARKARLTSEAVLAAVKGLDTKAVIARIEAVAAEERQRDDADAKRDAGLAELVQQYQAGSVDAKAVVDELAARLGAGAAPQS